MRSGTTFFALTLAGLLGANALAQQGDPLAQPSSVKTGIKPGTARKPQAKKARTPASTRMSLAQARAAARGRQTNQFVAPPLNGAADPLNLANEATGGALSGGVPFHSGNLPSGPGGTATGGLTGASDKQLIHGFDGDGVGELRADPGDGSHPRVSRLRGGSYVEGYGMPSRKGELVNGGNYIPGTGVTGQTMDATKGGTYTAGVGVIGSFDPRVSNQASDRLAGGGTMVPGFGVVGGGGALSSFGSGIPSAYGAGSLGSNYYGGSGSSFYGGSSLPNNSYGASGLLPSFGGPLTPGFSGVSGLNPGVGASPIPGGFGGGSLPSTFGASPIPSGFGGGSLPSGFGGASPIPSGFGAGSLPSTFR